MYELIRSSFIRHRRIVTFRKEKHAARRTRLFTCIAASRTLSCAVLRCCDLLKSSSNEHKYNTYYMYVCMYSDTWLSGFFFSTHFTETRLCILVVPFNRKCLERSTHISSRKYVTKCIRWVLSRFLRSIRKSEALPRRCIVTYADRQCQTLLLVFRASGVPILVAARVSGLTLEIMTRKMVVCAARFFSCIPSSRPAFESFVSDLGSRPSL